MNTQGAFGGYSVRERVKQYAKAAPTHDFDETIDAVPVGRRREKIRMAETADPAPRRIPGNNPYRVRDRMAKESAKRTAADEAIPKKQMAASPKSRPHAASRHSFEQRRRVGAEPDMRCNTDRIFEDESMSDGERIAAYRRAERRKALNHVRTISAALLIMSIFALAAFAIVYKTMYVISDFTVEGTSRYTAEEIIKASSVSGGDNLYSFSSRIAEENVTFHCPYVRTLDVNRSAPSKVSFTVVEDEPRFYADFYGETRALSASLRVLGTVDPSEAAESGLIRLRLPSVDSAMAGRILVFENERNSASMREVLGLVLASDLKCRITTVDLRSMPELKMICDDRYLLAFGGAEDMQVKLKIANAVMKDNLFYGNVRAEIDLTTTGTTSVVLDNQLDLES